MTAKAPRKPLERRTPLKRAGLPKRKAVAKRRLPSKRAETNRRDREFSRMIRDRDGSCQIRLASTCRGTADQCCHLISRRYRATRWDPENAVAGCVPCHLFGTTHPAEWTLWCVKHLSRVSLPSNVTNASSATIEVVYTWASAGESRYFDLLRRARGTGGPKPAPPVRIKRKDGAEAPSPVVKLKRG